MDLNRFTEKSQEALRSAQALAARRNHQGVDVEHLFTALLEEPEGWLRHCWPTQASVSSCDYGSLLPCREREGQRRNAVHRQSLRRTLLGLPPQGGKNS
jgi:ATP-dependent Clp protease ATP-binding subunit ClpA